MKAVTSILFLLSILLFFGAIWNALALKRPGFYPPKQVLKKRAAALAGGGAIFLLLTIILSSF
ncbi:hypothetical protein F4694_002332 [Bacillus niacini]|uniref:DUF3995 domain-containing protein n=1 Tax=Neobacillus niacini TaxID=86668 RepID=A0A852TC67_9BACI|nr:hypothetical protein [Neobacillus niacini]NYE05579.1 hypothetical protein [Neobacillus niacini]